MKFSEKQSLERILESLVVVSWADLMPDTQTGLIHIEYGFAAGGTLDYLKFWSSTTRGQWLLACEYWMSASTFHSTGVHFHNGYQSQGLAHILGSVMQHQTAFSLPADLGRQGLLQIPTPSQEESVVAAASVSEALDRVSSAPAQLVVA
ncbi:MAG: hypothetical protein LAO56_19300 [Acidobacteriia bacterium]|nr:hypothetical protein [Terriglobia bacterium]